ncbi:MAG: 50S ribosomal protein L7/L12 [Candidatus Pacebacteria bacterium]|nr:50S ribosomal protein L7/L12 [Candidatus Paceibacterota bacterium]
MSDEKKEVEAKEEKEVSTEDKKEVEVPKKFQDLVKQIEELSVLELSELVSVLEEKFGVSAAAPAMMAAIPQAGADGAEAEEKSDFDIELVAPGDAKIAIIKIIREVSGKGLKEAKDIVDSSPVVIKEKAPKAEAEELKKQLEDAGATVNLK